MGEGLFSLKALRGAATFSKDKTAVDFDDGLSSEEEILIAQSVFEIDNILKG